jgi:hypothetical protein
MCEGELGVSGAEAAADAVFCGEDDVGQGVPAGDDVDGEVRARRVDGRIAAEFCRAAVALGSGKSRMAKQSCMRLRMTARQECS